MSYWDEINEKIVELYTMLKHSMITLNELNERILKISGRA